MPRRRNKTRSKKRSTTNLLNNKKLSQQQCMKLNTYKIAKSIDHFQYTFVRLATNDGGITVPRSTTSLSEGWVFKLSDVQNSSEFTNLFDSYRILKCTLHFRPRIEEVNQLIGSAIPNAFKIPRIYIVRDYDDSAGMTIAQVKQRPDVIVYPCTKEFSISTVPQISDALYNDGVTTAYSTPYAARWVDCGSNSANHFGFKYLVEGSANATPGVGPEFGYDITIRYLMQFKGIR